MYDIIILHLFIIGTFAYAGAQFGTVICFPISGELAASNVGWPYIFYVFGALSIIWSIGFFIFGSDSPSKHSRISEKERRYIENSLKTVDKEEKTVDKEKSDNETVRIFFISYFMFFFLILELSMIKA